ncbi:hypothetical protein ACOMHN_027337 [Nucella lapillus]
MAAPLRLLEGREGGEPRGTGFKTPSIHKGTRFIRQIRLRNTRLLAGGVELSSPEVSRVRQSWPVGLQQSSS